MWCVSLPSSVVLGRRGLPAKRSTVTLLACVDGLVFDRLVNNGREGNLDRDLDRELDRDIGDLVAVALGRTASRGV